MFNHLLALLLGSGDATPGRIGHEQPIRCYEAPRKEEDALRRLDRQLRLVARIVYTLLRKEDRRSKYNRKFRRL